MHEIAIQQLFRRLSKVSPNVSKARSKDLKMKPCKGRSFSCFTPSSFFLRLAHVFRTSCLLPFQCALHRHHLNLKNLLHATVWFTLTATLIKQQNARYFPSDATKPLVHWYKLHLRAHLSHQLTHGRPFLHAAGSWILFAPTSI